MYLGVSGNARDAEETERGGFALLTHLGVAGVIREGPSFLNYQPPQILQEEAGGVCVFVLNRATNLSNILF